MLGRRYGPWVGTLKQTHKVLLEILARASAGFHVVRRRWVVEHTFAWLLNFRRPAKDYETRTRNSEALIQLAVIHLLIRRLA